MRMISIPPICLLQAHPQSQLAHCRLYPLPRRLLPHPTPQLRDASHAVRGRRWGYRNLELHSWVAISRGREVRERS